MSRLALVNRTRLNLAEVTVALSGNSSLEVDLLIQLFAGFGARQMRRAENLGQLRDVSAAEPIDLFILDAMSGLSDVVEVVKDIRRMTTQTRFAPIVLTTSNVSPSVLKTACNAGINYVVAKPLAPRILFERLIWIVKDARTFVESENYVGPDRRVRSLGPPAGMDGRRVGDLPPEVGDASTPNLSQEDIDAMMAPVRKSK